MKQISNKKVFVCGGGDFIGGHMVKRLKEQGYWVRSVDLKTYEFSDEIADETIIGDRVNTGRYI